MTICVPTETMLVLHICGAVHLGAQPASLTRPGPASSRHHVLADLPNQDLISGGTSNERSVRCEGEREDRVVVVNGHLELWLLVRIAGVPYGDDSILAAGCEKSFAIWSGVLAWLPL